MIGRVRRRPDRQAVVVVVEGVSAYVLGVDPDELQVLALAAGLAHGWDSTRCRWTFRPEDALPLAAALRACGRSPRLASGAAS